MMPDGEGILYVLVDVVGEPPGTVVDVFRESGHYLGRMSVPTIPVRLTGSLILSNATPSHLYFILYDETDVPYVSRLRIVRE